MKNKIFWVNADDDQVEIFQQKPEVEEGAVLDNEWIPCITLADLKEYIENSRSPDGDYPDADCIINNLESLSTLEKPKETNSSFTTDCFACQNCSHNKMCKWKSKIDTKSCDYWERSPS